MITADAMDRFYRNFFYSRIEYWSQQKNLFLIGVIETTNSFKKAKSSIQYIFCTLLILPF